MSKYGLLGEKLSHSFSKTIHEKLCSYTYDLLPMEKEELHEFLQKKDFCAVNVTIPYKQEVIPFLDVIDAKAEAIGAVNTIVNRDGVLYGYNTDFDGFLYNIRKNGISLQNKNVMILGSGGTMKTVRAVAESENAASVTVVGRTKKDGVITYEEAYELSSTEVIINATPCGMFPQSEDCPIDISKFPKLEAVADVIYNPLKTNLILEAEKAGIKSAGGLLMLVSQAKYAAEHFLGNPIPDEKADIIYKELLDEKTNLVLIGMPSCGKTAIGRELAKAMKKEFIDTDLLVEEKAGMKISDIFEKYGEAHFRKLESEAVLSAAAETGKIISTGGGVIKNEQNIRALKQNGIICFIDRPVNLLEATPDRPLSRKTEDIKRLYDDRYPLYTEYCDFYTVNDSTISCAVNLIKEKYNEILGY